MSKFIQYGNKTLTMPEGMTLEQAKQLMARHFPELVENIRELKSRTKMRTEVVSLHAPSNHIR